MAEKLAGPSETVQYVLDGGALLHRIIWTRGATFACSTIIHALISGRLDYFNSILYNVPRSKMDQLQRFQNQCARILKNIATQGTYYHSFEKITLAENSRYNHI